MCVALCISIISQYSFKKIKIKYSKVESEKGGSGRGRREKGNYIMWYDIENDWLKSYDNIGKNCQVTDKFISINLLHEQYTILWKYFLYLLLKNNFCILYNIYKRKWRLQFSYHEFLLQLSNYLLPVHFMGICSSCQKMIINVTYLILYQIQK